MTTANGQVDTELIDEFLIVEDQTKIDFGELDGIAGSVLANRVKLVIAVLEQIQAHVLLAEVRIVVCKVVSVSYTHLTLPTILLV